MRCLDPGQVAAAVSEGDDRAFAHTAVCTRCAQLLDEQRTVRALVKRTADLAVSSRRYEAMAAELMARADQPEIAPQPMFTPHSRRRRVLPGAALLAAAAAIAIVAFGGSERNSGSEGSQPPTPSASAPTTRDGESSSHQNGAPAGPSGGPATPTVDAHPVVDARAAVRSNRVAAHATDSAHEPQPAPQGTEPTATLTGAGDYAPRSRDPSALRDVVALRAGELTVDATASRAMEIVANGTSIVVERARVKVISTGGAVSSVAVFAGSAQFSVDGRRVVVESGEIWDRASARESAIAAFGTGWAALRAGDNQTAIAMFDRATDPTVAEDALYWSAIASERAGQSPDALRRYQRLIDQFPATTRIIEARAAVARLAPRGQ